MHVSRVHRAGARPCVRLGVGAVKGYLGVIRKRAVSDVRVALKRNDKREIQPSVRAYFCYSPGTC